MKRRVPFGRDERDVRDVIACAMRVYVHQTKRPIRPLARELRWHTTQADAWLGPTERMHALIDHVWLMKERSRIDHAKGFLRALYAPAKPLPHVLALCEDEVRCAYLGNNADRTFAKAATPAAKRKAKRIKTKPTMTKKLALLTKTVAEHAAELKTIERRARFLKKKLRSDRAQLRAGQKAMSAGAIPHEEAQAISDNDLARLVGNLPEHA